LLGLESGPRKLGVVDEVETQLGNAFDVAFPLLLRPMLWVVVDTEMGAFLREKFGFICEGRDLQERDCGNEGREQFVGIHIMITGDVAARDLLFGWGV
jgi:hypothetical protein